jgi:hypothetical protein
MSFFFFNPTHFPTSKIKILHISTCLALNILQGPTKNSWPSFSLVFGIFTWMCYLKKLSQCKDRLALIIKMIILFEYVFFSLIKYRRYFTKRKINYKMVTLFKASHKLQSNSIHKDKLFN